MDVVIYRTRVARSKEFQRQTNTLFEHTWQGKRLKTPTLIYCRYDFQVRRVAA